MKTLLGLCLGALLSAVPLTAQHNPVRAIAHVASTSPHFTMTHKQLLIRDLLVGGVYLAAYKTFQCYRPAPCEDQTVWFPSHPSHADVGLAVGGILTVWVGQHHAVYHLDKEPNKATANVVGWMETATLLVSEGWDAAGNAKFTLRTPATRRTGR